MARKSSVREPVQVYLDPQDKSLLDEMANQTNLSRAELLRRGLRRLADSLLVEAKPGSSLDSIIGSLGDAEDLPTDLSARHDEYLYGSRAD